MIPVSKPSIGEKEKKYVADAMETGWISSAGNYIEKFEKKFAKYIGTKYAVACSSGTTALLLALRAAGIREGDEVIVPDFTMIATAWAVTYLGAKPVFVDCDENLNIDTCKIPEAITSKTRAIMPVHIYGRPVNMDEINRLAYEHNLAVIEDAAEAHGAEYKGKKVGSIGDMGCFSLYANKIITAGEGGVITTDNEKLANQLRHLRAMAFDPDHTFYHPKIAYNFRMTNLQAAVALGQVERIDKILEKREKIKSWYDKYLAEFRIPTPPGSVLWMYDVVMDDNDYLISELKKKGVEARRFFKPMKMQPMYQKDFSYIGTSAMKFSQTGIYLPTYTDITKKEVEKVALTLLKIYDDER